MTAHAVPGDAVPGDAVPGDAAPGDAAPGDAAPGDAAPGDAEPFFTPVEADEVAAGDGADLVSVHLRNAPLALWSDAERHSDELLREFALIQLGQEQERHADVPRRLLELSEALGARYAAATAAPDARRAAATQAGERHADLTYVVPPFVRRDALRLEAMLAEADDYCRTGRDLLTLARPPELVAFAAWFVGEFVAQVDGREATPWRD